MKKTAIVSVLIFILLLAGCGKTQESDIKKVIVAPYASEAMTFEYTSPEKVGAVTEYISGIGKLEETSEDPMNYVGMTYVIYLINDKEERFTYIQFGNRFFKEGEGPWCEISTEKAAKLEEIFKENEPDVPAKMPLFPD